jgi:hypothetical protein
VLLCSYYPGSHWPTCAPLACGCGFGLWAAFSSSFQSTSLGNVAVYSDHSADRTRGRSQAAGRRAEQQVEQGS